MPRRRSLSPLAGFLSHASLEAGDNQAQAGQDALQMMTVHSAKGLEFHAVFIGGLEEGLFPHENSMNEPGGPEEERRLMYVAITRARQRLYISFAQSRMLHGQTRYGIKSRFIEELPEGAVKWLTPRVRASAGGRFGQWHDTGVAPSIRIRARETHARLSHRPVSQSRALRRGRRDQSRRQRRRRARANQLRSAGSQVAVTGGCEADVVFVSTSKAFAWFGE